MSSALQHTLAGPISASGVGLHSGRRVRATVRPAPDGHGIRVVPIGRPAAEAVSWTEPNVRDTLLATVVGTAEWRVSTAEHLVAALVGLEVDNALVEVDGPEVPILDGSAAPWVEQVREVGRTPGQTRRVRYTITEPVEVRAGAAWARLDPSDALVLDVRIDFPHAAVGMQELVVRPTPDRFEAELCWARTFGFEADVQRLRDAGKALGGSLANAVVFGADRVLNPGGLRAPDEAVRHKMLDLVGDIGLFGVPVCARLTASRPGHSLTRALVRAALPRLVPRSETA